MKVQKNHKNVKDPWEQSLRVVVVVVLSACVQGQGEPGPTLVVPSAFSFLNHDGIFTMVRSNLKKKFRDFYHGSSVGAGSPKAKMRPTEKDMIV